MRKKRFLISFVIPVTLFVISLLLYHKFSIDDQKIDVFKIPEISAITYDGSLFELSKLEKSEKTVVFFFSPECEHCEEEINGLLQRPSLLEDSNIRWIFITMDVLKDELGVFFESFPINKKSNVYILLDSGLYYHNLFEVTGAPSVFIFDKSESLVHKIIGGFNINILSQWL